VTETLYRTRAPKASEVGDTAKLIETTITVGCDEVFSVLAHLGPLRQKLSMLLAEPVHSEVVARKTLLENTNVFEKISQPSPFHAGVGVHHIFRYAGTQQPFLLHRGGRGECV